MVPERRHLTISFLESPASNVSSQHRLRDKKRKSIFQVHSPVSMPKRMKLSHPQIFLLPQLNASVTRLTRSLLAKRKGALTDKSWRKHSLPARSPSAENINSSGTGRLVSVMGPDPPGSRASTPASFTSNAPNKRGRGNGRRGRGRGGRGGRGRGGGRAGRSEDSPEPPRKKILSEAEKEVLADLKARQGELKKLFKEIGAQQHEALSLLATRDLGKIVKKNKAHEKVPGHKAILKALQDRRKEAEQFARGKYEHELRHARILHDSGKEVIEQRYRGSSSRSGSRHSSANFCPSRPAVSKRNQSIKPALRVITSLPGKPFKP